jgi:phosphoglucosamine mutase
MTKKYFGTDGIRGKVGQYPITPEFIMRLGYAAGVVLTKNNCNTGSGQKPTVLIGKDTRVSGYMLEAALEAGFAAAGVDVMLSGPMPTPAIAYLTRALRLSAGVVISASHNPYDDNGIKFFSAHGGKLSDDVELEIEAQLDQPMDCVASDYLGKARRLKDANGRYIEFCKSTYPTQLNLRGLKIVVDCAHGAAYDIAPQVYHELGAEVISIGNKPNGFNINDKVGATAPEALALAVIANHADLGIALDGDADRLIMVDRFGKVYDGDQLLYLMLLDRLAIGPVKGVVGTLMTNMAVEIAIKNLGVEFYRAKVGDRYVLEQMQRYACDLGGEGSGHLLCLDKHSTGDGIISSLQVLSALQRSNKTLDNSFESLKLFPQVLINVRVSPGTNWQDNQSLVSEKTQVENELHGRGRVLIRASGTEPLIRVMVEADEEELAQTCAERLANCLR